MPEQPAPRHANPASQAEDNFKKLLRELFQFSKGDLDFGIYRIMNQKRDALEKFIDEEIVKAVDSALAQTGDVSTENKEKAEVLERAKSDLGTDAFDADGNLKPEFSISQAGKLWRVLNQSNDTPAPPTDAMRMDVFNRLHDFFSRYYDDGDFMCKRRYAAKDRYAIPYNGQEVVLHWANKDQYYIKTSEHFACYSFEVKKDRIHFVMREADVEEDNKKPSGSNYFIPMANEFSPISGVKNAFQLPFQYRALTDEEKAHYAANGGERGNGLQRSIVAAAIEELPPAAKPFAKDEKEHPLLQKHIEKYISRNMADFFIHKNLHRFLREELDYFINSEMLSAKSMTRSNASAAANCKAAKAVRQAAKKAIDVLAQLEGFQKSIWEKKKFITETQYCITLNRLPGSLLPEVAECKGQWQEWVTLSFCEAKMLKASKSEKMEFMRQHPTLVVDTAHFTQKFKDALLTSCDNLDEAIDGVLFHSENWQALNLLQEKYRSRISCVYVDPPYNTGSDFVYKDAYQTSSWLSLVLPRLQLLKGCMTRHAGLYMQLDHYADYLGRMLLQSTFPNVDANNQTIITWNTGENISGFKTQKANWIRQMDKILFFPHDPARLLFRELYAPFDKSVEVKKDKAGWLDLFRSKSGNPSVEKWVDGRLQQVEVCSDKELKTKRIGTVWNDIYSFQYSEPRESESFSFKTQKPENLLRRIVQSCTNPGDFVLDPFAGIGTTGAVAQKMSRKFVLVEMGEHFRTFYSDGSEKKVGLLGRMKIVLHGDKRFFLLGKPRRPHLSKDVNWEGGGFLKYHRIESYDDALENIELEKDSGASDDAARQVRNYTRRYMLKMESRGCATFPSAEQLKSPFKYTLERANGERAVADLPETFSYLTGMREQSRRVHHNDRHRYVIQRGIIKGRQTAVIWRDTAGWIPADYKKDRDFIKSLGIPANDWRIYTNDNSTVENAQSLTPLFTARMFGGHDE